LASDAPAWSPYRYGFNNPVNITDPDGNFEDGWIYDQETDKIIHINDVGGKNTQFVTFAAKNKDGSYSDTGGTIIYQFSENSNKSDCPVVNWINSFDKTNGGISMTKSGGQGEENKISANPDDIGNVDMLMAALGTAMKATKAPNMHTLEGIANFVLGNLESGMDVAEIIENAVSSDISENKKTNSTSNNNEKNKETLFPVKYENPNRRRDTLYKKMTKDFMSRRGGIEYIISNEEYKKHKK